MEGRNIMKKLLSVIIAAVMLFTLASPAMAAGDEEYNGNPVIIVRGIAFASLRYEDGREALQINGGEILGLLLQCVTNRFIFKNDDALYDTVREAANNIFSPLAYDKDGNSVNDLHMVEYDKSLANFPKYGYFGDAEGGLVKEAVKRYGAENVYLFRYDWRKSPEVLAGELNALVETAKKDSGKDKVNILCASMGCMVTTAYFDYYGYDSVDRAVYISGAHNGVYSLGDAFSGNLSIHSDLIKEMVFNSFEGNTFMEVLIRIFDILGAFDVLTDFLNNWIDGHYDRANDEIFRDCFGTLPGFWAMCPDDRFDEAYETVFGDCEDEYAGIAAVVRETGRFVKNTENTLLEAYQSGVKLSFVAGYNASGVPVYDNAVLNSDGVIETVLASNGATVANYGEVLSEAEINDRAYLSPDRVIDASTALFKDCTWFIKNAEHVATDYGTECNAFVFMLLEYEGQPDIGTFEEYPQFLVTDASWNLEILK